MFLSGGGLVNAGGKHVFLLFSFSCSFSFFVLFTLSATRRPDRARIRPKMGVSPTIFRAGSDFARPGACRLIKKSKKLKNLSPPPLKPPSSGHPKLEDKADRCDVRRGGLASARHRPARASCAGRVEHTRRRTSRRRRRIHRSRGLERRPWFGPMDR